MEEEQLNQYSSQQQFLNYLQECFKILKCNVPNHISPLSSICIDPKCNPDNQQYQLLCLDCIKSNVHCQPEHTHKTVELKTFFSEFISQTYSSEYSNLKSSQKKKSVSKADQNLPQYQIKNLLKDTLQQLQVAQFKLNEIIASVQDKLSETDSAVKAEQNAYYQKRGKIKEILAGALKSKTQNTLQDFLQQLKQFSRITDNDQILIDYTITPNGMNSQVAQLSQIQLFKEKVFSWSQQIQTLTDFTTNQAEVKFLSVFNYLINATKISFDKLQQLIEVDKFNHKAFGFPIMYQNKSTTYNVIQNFDEALEALFKISDNIQENESKENKKKQGYFPATFLLGFFYFYGFGVNSDYSLAFKYFTLSNASAGSEGYAVAQFYLALFSIQGWGTEKNDKLGIQHYRQSASAEFAQALADLGYYYYFGQHIAQDYNIALQYLKLSAAQQNAYGCYFLGLCYEEGKAIQKDIAMALKYYKLGAEQGDTNCKVSLGNIYKNGVGVEQSYTLAFNYYLKAVEEGNISCNLQLGQMYENGLGTEINLVAAKKHYQIAADNKNKEARELLDKLNSKMM